MIALTVADWPLSRRLLLEHRRQVDMLETTGFLAEQAAAQFAQLPLLLHNSVNHWSLGTPDALGQQDVLPRTLHLLAATRAPWLSVHLGFSAADVASEHATTARSPVIGRDELFATICRNVQTLAESIPVPLILENLDYQPGGAYEWVCEPEFIRAVLEETGTGLLLDLAHARVSAARLGLSIQVYLARLPLDRTWQIHISGPRLRDGILVDAHEPLQTEDYVLLTDVLSTTKVHALTLEYWSDEAALLGQVGRLREILQLADTS